MQIKLQHSTDTNNNILRENARGARIYGQTTQQSDVNQNRPKQQFNQDLQSVDILAQSPVSQQMKTYNTQQAYVNASTPPQLQAQQSLKIVTNPKLQYNNIKLFRPIASYNFYSELNKIELFQNVKDTLLIHSEAGRSKDFIENQHIKLQELDKISTLLKQAILNFNCTENNIIQYSVQNSNQLILSLNINYSNYLIPVQFKFLRCLICHDRKYLNDNLILRNRLLVNTKTNQLVNEYIIKQKPQQQLQNMKRIEFNYLINEQCFTVRIYDDNNKQIRSDQVKYQFIHNESVSYNLNVPILDVVANQIIETGLFRVVATLHKQVISSKNIFLRKVNNQVCIVDENSDKVLYVKPNNIKYQIQQNKQIKQIPQQLIEQAPQPQTHVSKKPLKKPQSVIKKPLINKPSKQGRKHNIIRPEQMKLKSIAESSFNTSISKEILRSGSKIEYNMSVTSNPNLTASIKDQKQIARNQSINTHIEDIQSQQAPDEKYISTRKRRSPQQIAQKSLLSSNLSMSQNSLNNSIKTKGNSKVKTIASSREYPTSAVIGEHIKYTDQAYEDYIVEIKFFVELTQEQEENITYFIVNKYQNNHYIMSEAEPQVHRVDFRIYQINLQFFNSDIGSYPQLLIQVDPSNPALQFYIPLTYEPVKPANDFIVFQQEAFAMNSAIKCVAIQPDLKINHCYFTISPQFGLVDQKTNELIYLLEDDDIDIILPSQLYLSPQIHPITINSSKHFYDLQIFKDIITFEDELFFKAEAHQKLLYTLGKKDADLINFVSENFLAFRMGTKYIFVNFKAIEQRDQVLLMCMNYKNHLFTNLLLKDPQSYFLIKEQSYRDFQDMPYEYFDTDYRKSLVAEQITENNDKFQLFKIIDGQNLAINVPITIQQKQNCAKIVIVAQQNVKLKQENNEESSLQSLTQSSKQEDKTQYTQYITRVVQFNEINPIIVLDTSFCNRKVGIFVSCPNYMQHIETSSVIRHPDYKQIQQILKTQNEEEVFFTAEMTTFDGQQLAAQIKLFKDKLSIDVENYSFGNVKYSSVKYQFGRLPNRCLLLVKNKQYDLEFHDEIDYLEFQAFFQ